MAASTTGEFQGVASTIITGGRLWDIKERHNPHAAPSDE